jgi:hypothetical protein
MSDGRQPVPVLRPSAVPGPAPDPENVKRTKPDESLGESGWRAAVSPLTLNTNVDEEMSPPVLSLL